MNYLEEEIIESIEDQDINELKKIIKENPNFQLDFDSQNAIYEAASIGNLEIVKYLSSFKEVNCSDLQSVYIAAMNDHLEVLKFLFKNHDIKLSFKKDYRLIKVAFDSKSYKSALYLYKLPFFKEIFMLLHSDNDFVAIKNQLIQMEKIQEF
jgi:hypothetical protein